MHQWRRRLSVSVKAGGGHFDHYFDFYVVFAAIAATFLAVVDQSNSCTLILVQLQLSVMTALQ